jgi:hypothetical protein
MSESVKKGVFGLVVAAVVMIAVNVGIWVGAQENVGILPPIKNVPLWFAFVVLNVISLVWAIALLGLRPLIVAVSYVAGAGIAFYGVKETEGMALTEVITAGAIYGAFGALAIGNFSTKVRLAFFSKGQIPFVFVVVVLLVIDGVLNSQLFQAGGVVLLKALVAPFVLAGGIVGVAEVMIRNSVHETGRIHDEMPVQVDLSEKKKKRMLDAALGGTMKEFRIGTPANKPEVKPAEPATPDEKPAEKKSGGGISPSDFFVVGNSKPDIPYPRRDD